MTKAEHYAAGFASGCRWAERDIRDGTLDFPNYRAISPDAPDWYRASELGFIRGYRDTVARFEADSLTYTMFESGPP